METMSLYQVTFQYFDHFDDRCEVTLHANTEQQANDVAFIWSLKNGDGDFDIVSLKKVL